MSDQHKEHVVSLKWLHIVFNYYIILSDKNITPLIIIFSQMSLELACINGYTCSVFFPVQISLQYLQTGFWPLTCTTLGKEQPLLWKTTRKENQKLKTPKDVFSFT